MSTKNGEGRAASRREVERDARRGFIVEAARTLLAERGIADVRMDDVATTAAYTRRTLYAYFKSRDDVLLHVHLEDLARRREAQVQAMAGIEGSLGRIAAWAEALFAYWQENHPARRLEQHWDFHGIEPDRISPEVFARFEAVNELLAEDLRALFRAGVEEGALRADTEVDVTVSHFVHTLRAVLGRALSSSYSFAHFEPPLYVRHFLDLFLRGIRRDN